MPDDEKTEPGLYRHPDGKSTCQFRTGAQTVRQSKDVRKLAAAYPDDDPSVPQQAQLIAWLEKASGPAFKGFHKLKRNQDGSPDLKDGTKMMSLLEDMDEPVVLQMLLCALGIKSATAQEGEQAPGFQGDSGRDQSVDEPNRDSGAGEVSVSSGAA